MEPWPRGLLQLEATSGGVSAERLNRHQSKHLGSGCFSLKARTWVVYRGIQHPFSFSSPVLLLFSHVLFSRFGPAALMESLVESPRSLPQLFH